MRIHPEKESLVKVLYLKQYSLDDCDCCWYQTLGFRATIKVYLTYKMRKRTVVYKIGKLMDGFAVHAEVSYMSLVDFALHI